MARVPKPQFKAIESLIHDEAKRRNIPTAELQALYEREAAAAPKTIHYPRATPLEPGQHRERNPDLDPQLVWRGKDEQDWSDLVVHAPPLYIQEKVHPKVIIEDLRRQSRRSGRWSVVGGQSTNHQPPATDHSFQPDLFADFNGLPDTEARLEFYQHDQNWSNRMILGDSLQVMASLAEREGLRGQVQCIYLDPPYGIRFNSNWQVSTRSRDVKDGKADQISREPEQIKAFRDTWKDGIHSYLAYLRDRLMIVRDLLHETGAIFVQIGDENVHRVRAVMDEIFGEENAIALVTIEKTSGQTQDYISPVADYILWFAKRREAMKYRSFWVEKTSELAGFTEYSRVQSADLQRRRMSAIELNDRSTLASGVRIYRQDNLTSQSMGRQKGEGAASWFEVKVEGQTFRPSLQNRWKTNELGMKRLLAARRAEPRGNSLSYVRFLGDFPVAPINNIWRDVKFSSRSEEKTYIVQTAARMLERCIAMTTDPGDLVLDPTCGSGTTAYVAEQWGRRWITIDTSRVALALARARIMGARYPYYLLADSEDGRRKEAEITGKVPADGPTHGDIRQGFVYERVPHITLKSIANNAAIDVIWEKWQPTLEPLRAALHRALGESWEEWQIPRGPGENWPPNAKDLHARWWQARIARQKEIDGSIARAADVELLYDKPYADSGKVRVAGPFTVESLSPHRVIPSDEYEAGEEVEAAEGARRRRSKLPYEREGETDFSQVVLEHLRTAGVQQAHKQDRIGFTSLSPWPGEYVGAEGRFMEGVSEKRAAILIGPEFGTISRPDLIAAAREAAEARVRRADRLRLRLRRPCFGVLQARGAAGAARAHEPRSAHGGRAQEHRGGQPVRGVRRAGCGGGWWAVAGGQWWEDGSRS